MKQERGEGGRKGRREREETNALLRSCEARGGIPKRRKGARGAAGDEGDEGPGLVATR